MSNNNNNYNSLIPLLEKHKDEICKIIFEAKVVGTTFRPDANNILKYLYTVDSKNIILKFEREPENKYDKNAVKVIVGLTGSNKEHFIGYIGKNLSDFFTHIIDLGEYVISVEDIKIVGGDNIGVANYGLWFSYRIKRR